MHFILNYGIAEIFNGRISRNTLPAHIIRKLLIQINRINLSRNVLKCFR